MSRYRSAVCKLARDVSAKELEGSLQDYDHRGAVSEADFQEVLQDLRIELSRSEMSEVVRELGVDRKGNIDYKELCDDVRKERDNGSDSGRRTRRDSRGSSSDGRPSAVHEGTIRKLKNGAGDLIKQFQRQDSSDRGYVSEDICRKILNRELRDRLTNDEMRHLVRELEKRPGNNQIVYDDLMSKFNLKGSGGSGGGSVGGAGEKLKRFLERDNRDDDGKCGAEKLIDEFERIDQDLNNQVSGKLAHRDFSDAFDAGGLSFTDKQLHALLQEYPKDKRGCASYKDVLKDHGYDAEQILARKKLTREIKKEKRDENGRTGLERVKGALEGIDRDVNEEPLGMLTPGQMCEAMVKVDISFTNTQMKALVGSHHLDAVGRVNYIDVLRQLSGKKTVQLSIGKEGGARFMDEKSWTKKNGSVGEWLVHAATPLERRNFHELMTLLNKFERDHGLQQTDGQASGHHVVLPLGPDLKVAMRFFV
jgi:Ca2+-binding EF-hand superfamily protein